MIEHKPLNSYVKESLRRCASTSVVLKAWPWDQQHGLETFLELHMLNPPSPKLDGWGPGAWVLISPPQFANQSSR